jgi:dihydroxy-acid dehydratase
VPLDNDDWQKIGHKIPLIVNLQPTGEYLGETITMPAVFRRYR